MIAIPKFCQGLSFPPPGEMLNLSLESTLRELSLYDFQVESSLQGREVAKLLQLNPILPGFILTQHGKFLGMISRRRFLEQLSRPYGLELFGQRPVSSLYRFVNQDILILKQDTKIVEATRYYLRRPPELLYEPIVIEVGGGNYRLLDAHQLLIAQSKIHELTTQLLQEQTQAQLMQTEKMASLGQMVAGIAHEIKNPVACITGNFDFLVTYCHKLIEILKAYEAELPQPSASLIDLKEEAELDFILEDLPKMLNSIGASSERLMKIVGSLYSFSHLDESQRQFANIHDCIESTLVILNNRLKNGIQLVKDYADLPAINCYSGQLTQVFMNIISNALDALSEKINLLGSDSQLWQPRIEVHTSILERSAGNWISVRIADNASGIPLDIQSRIFERFFTTKPVGKGTGLGLAISYQIVTQKHGGELLMFSLPNQGTEFQVLLPLV